MRTTLRTIKDLLGFGYAAPRRYWERRYRRLGSSVSAPGCIDLDPARNEADYELKWDRIRAAIARGCPPPSPSVLDAGCGNGVLTAKMILEGWDVTAVDFSPAAVRAARDRVGESVIWECSPIESYEPGRTFDVVVNADVLHHVVEDSLFVRTLERLCRLTDPAGMLVVNTHLADPVEAASPTPSHVRWRDLPAFVAALPDGWAVVENERYLLPEEGTTKDLLIIRHA